MIPEMSDPSSWKDDLNVSKYPDTEYDNSSSTSLKISVCCVESFSTWLTDKDLIEQSNIWSFPLGMTSIVLEVEYPMPALTIFSSETLPSEIIALNLAPVPDPVGSLTITSGIEK